MATGSHARGPPPLGQSAAEESETRVCLSRLPEEVNRSELSDVFGQYGTIRRWTFGRNSACIEYLDHSSASKAVIHGAHAVSKSYKHLNKIGKCSLFFLPSFLPLDFFFFLAEPPRASWRHGLCIINKISDDWWSKNVHFATISVIHMHMTTLLPSRRPFSTRPYNFFHFLFPPPSSHSI